MTETLQDMSTSSQKTEAAGEAHAPTDEPVEVEPAQLEVSPSAAELDIARELVRSAALVGSR